MLINPPLWTQNGSYTASQDRQLIASLVRTEGVSSVDSMVPSVVLNTRNISISSGGAYVDDDHNASGSGGRYFIRNQGAYSITIPPAPGTNRRYDLIVLRIHDSDVSGATNSAEYEIVRGAESANPVIPSAPLNSIPIAAVLSRPGATSLQASDLSDERIIAHRASQVIGNLSKNTETKMDRFASPSNPILITSSDNPADLKLSTGSGFNSVGGVQVHRNESTIPKSANDGAMATAISSGRTYQWRDGKWKFFHGWGPYISYGIQNDIRSYLGPYVGGMILNVSPNKYEGNVKFTGDPLKSSPDYRTYFTLSKGTTGSSANNAGGITFNIPGMYHYEYKVQAIGKTNGTRLRGRIESPGASNTTDIDNGEFFVTLSKGEEYITTVSGSVAITNVGKTHGRLIPFLRASTPITLAMSMMRVELKYEF